MGKQLLNDFNDQRKSIIWLLMITTIVALIGFAFRSIFYCTSTLITAGACIIYFNCFFNDHFAATCFDKNEYSEDDDRILRILRKKLQVRTKYVEILFLAFMLYILVSVVFVIDAIDNGFFANPNYGISQVVTHIALFPTVMIFVVSATTPFLFIKKMNRAGFMCLAIVSIILPYGVFLLDFFTGFTESKQIMTILPFPVIGIAFISFFIAMSTVIKKS